jgi:methionine--tRNA ligase beta chain
MIEFEEFKKVELRVAKIISSERIEGSEKLLKLMVDCGDKDETGISKTRQVLAGVGKVYTPEEMVGREIIIVVNLAPRMMMGLESQGMLLAADSPEGPILVRPDRDVAPGAEIR